MIVLKDGCELEMSINAQRKTAIKKLFAKAHGLKKEIATLSDIKKVYKLNFKSPISWFAVMAECIEMLEKAEITPVKELENFTASLPKEFYRGRINTFLGANCTLNKNNMLLGTLGYSQIHGKWYFSIGRNGRNFYMQSLSSAFNMLTRTSSNAA